MAGSYISFLYRNARRRALAGSGVPARILRRGWPARPAWHGGLLEIAREAGLGDVLMVTPLLREAKRRSPAVRTVLYTTKYAALVRGLPFIDEIRPFNDKPDHVPILGYEDAIAPRAPLPQIMADWMGLRLDDAVPECVVDARRLAHFEAEWALLPRPWIVVLRRASRWTPNKDWPDERWAALLARLAEGASVIEIGDLGGGLAEIPSANYTDLRGRTVLEDLPAVLAAADLHIGPVSGPMHIAAAVGVPTVTICGGYEHPRGHAYPRNRILYTQTPCAPCWLTGPCPHQHACLTAISVADVEAAIREMLYASPAQGRDVRVLV